MKEQGAVTFFSHYLFTNNVCACVRVHECLVLLLMRPESPQFEIFGSYMSALPPALISSEPGASQLAWGHLRLGKQIWPYVCHELDVK